MKWLWRHIDNSFKQALPLRKLHYKAKSGDQRTIDTVYINAIYPPAPPSCIGCEIRWTTTRFRVNHRFRPTRRQTLSTGTSNPTSTCFNYGAKTWTSTAHASNVMSTSSCSK